ncbi:AB hydrolase superfamily protein [Pseudolycoriella hygida]|uniref:AB hydrolase superfamily protein n=1 Tax=Pseudolycoriella hygida TaxID=35572 RepID=A0A9Q0RW86_9DIPT|nr:AB hydrolase superfamily protein [Pseudolycoriella hygida]
MSWIIILFPNQVRKSGPFRLKLYLFVQRTMFYIDSMQKKIIDLLSLSYFRWSGLVDRTNLHTMSIGHWFLRLKVVMFRALMALGMKFHRKAEPKAPQHNFKIVIPSRLSAKGGEFELVFYVPEGYFRASSDYKYPVVVNFHGGGFALGSALDDARWASKVMQNVDAVVVSVEYRLAPEHPFSVAQEDGSDAIIYLMSHAKELRLDESRIALSGFSAGGNLAFSVPLMLWDLKNEIGKRELRRFNIDKVATTSRTILSHSKTIYKSTEFETTDLEITQKFPDFSIKCIVSFYPPLDFRQPRAEKRATNPKPEKNLPTFLTNLFDESFMYPRDKVDDSDPYLSPSAASDELLRTAYPEDIVLFTCEYDMLNAEGVAFGDRLSKQLGKNVYGGVIKDVAHAFDKMPNPKKYLTTTDECYSTACAELTKAFATKFDGKRQLHNELND